MLEQRGALATFAAEGLGGGGGGGAGRGQSGEHASHQRGAGVAAADGDVLHRQCHLG